MLFKRGLVFRSNGDQESIIGAALEFVRLEEKLGDVSRQLMKMQQDIEGCMKGAQVGVRVVVVVVLVVVVVVVVLVVVVEGVVFVLLLLL